jgi:nucleoside-diphosphate-sugar epimerase
VRQLADAGRAVRVLARSPSKLPRELVAAGVDVVRGDLGSPDDLRRALAGIETVCHLARANVKSWEDYQRDEIGVTRAVAEAALAAGVKRFVYTGTIDSYYCGASAGTITEDTPLDPAIDQRNLYARAKAYSEALLVALRKERGLPLVIVRPGIVIGRGGSPFHWGVGMWHHGSVCSIWGRGENKLPLVLCEDVARGLVAAMDAPGIEGESFNLVADPALTAQEYLDALDRCGGFRLQRRAVPIARFYAYDLFKWVAKVLVRHPERRLPSYRDWESRTQRGVFANARARTRLGWSPVSDPAELVRRGIEEPLQELLG